MSNTTINLANCYYGALANCGAACCTHPLDLLKVHLQTQQVTKLGGMQIAMKIVKCQGFIALYNGLSASLLRQVSYSATRFSIYECLKMQIARNKTENLPFHQLILIAGVSGACGGFIGAPGDMINVRMQNDVKLPHQQRRNYKHAFDGIYRVIKEEGVAKLFRGSSVATCQAVFMTVGQLAFFDQIKRILLSTSYFTDNFACHLTTSVAACAVATTMTLPVDVIKTRAMNAKPGEYKNLLDIITYTAKMGPKGFFKGFVPAFVRLGPHTMLTFFFFEKLRRGWVAEGSVSQCQKCQGNHGTSACYGNCHRTS